MDYQKTEDRVMEILTESSMPLRFNELHKHFPLIPRWEFKDLLEQMENCGWLCLNINHEYEPIYLEEPEEW